MPRKKTIQPAPLEIFHLDDGTPVEIRDETCCEIRRGSHKTDSYVQKRDHVLEKVFNDYLDARKGRVKPKTDYLSTATRFAGECELWGFGSVDGNDDSALRKKLYPDIVKQVIYNSKKRVKSAV